MKKGFSIIELLVVISIIGYLAYIVIGSLNTAREKGNMSRARQELKNVAQALELYAIDHGGYPPDVARGLPNGIEAYLPGGVWPTAVWPGSVFDWDNGVDSSSGLPIYQISIRFCPAGGPLSACQFPPESWAANFDVNSSLYYCVQGACRAHLDEVVNYPGYCINCF